MEFEERNPKPKENSKNLPVIVLGALIAIICLLLYVGWNFMSDDASSASEMTDQSVKAVGEFDNSQEDDQIGQEPAVSESAPLPEETVAEEKVKAIEEPKVKTPETSKPAEKPLKGEVYTHTVEANETFYGIANRYNVSGSTLKRYNPDVDPAGIKVGITKIKVPVEAIHVVGPGDILRVVAKKYEISLDQLMKANGKDKNHSQRGEKLVIPHKEKQ